MSLSIIVLGAGRGTRMKSSLPKVLHKIAGREMINLVLDTAAQLNPTNIAVVISEEIQPFVADLKISHPVRFVVQKERLGTAHAVETGLKALKKIGNVVLVLYADTPLLKVSTLQEMIKVLAKNTVAVLGFECQDDNKYGRLVVEKSSLKKIVEYKDASPEERNITLCNSGVIAVKGAEIKNLLSKIDNNNASGEYYLTDIVGIARKKGWECGFLKVSESEVMGVNSRVELAKAEKIKQKEIRTRLMEEGVTMLNPKSVYFSFDTKIAADVTIEPNVFFGLNVEIESAVEIRSFCHVEGAKIKSGAVIGPFARIRPHTTIGCGAKIGNFVEIKKSTIKQNAKISHLSYVGDAEIGEDANIGAGTITCNYDGYKKYPTKIGKNVFIGSNTALVAPIVVGDNAVIGAGSVITKDVKSNDLAISRPKQETIKDGGKNYHKKRKT